MSVEPSHTESASTLPNTRRVWAVALLVSLSVLGLAALVSFGPFAKEAQVQAKTTAVRPIPVRVAKVQRETLELSAVYRGELVAETAELAAETSGRLIDVYVNIGDKFKKGKLLARVDATLARRQLAEARAQLSVADASQQRVLAQLAAAKTELARGKALRAENLVNQQQFDALKANVSVLEAELEAAAASQAQARARIASLGEVVVDTKLSAPFDGAVAERFLDPGALVQAGTVVLRLVQQGPLRVRFRIPERDLGRVSKDMALEVRTQATGKQRFLGKLTRISAEVSRDDRTAAAEGVLTDEADVLRPGMYAEAALTLGTLKDALVVPSEALIEDKDEQSPFGVYVVQGQHAKFVPVRVLGRSGSKSAVDGVKPGQQVVTLGLERLRDGAAVEIVSEEAK